MRVCGKSHWLQQCSAGQAKDGFETGPEKGEVIMGVCCCPLLSQYKSAGTMKADVSEVI